MNIITGNLWIGDYPSALNIQQLRENKIHSVLSVMRGKLKIHETFIRHQIALDDSQDADILSQFSPAIQFIGGELEKGRGVLVHCQAGISRSPTIVAAYLIYTLNISPDEALGIILEQRPFVQPNPNFFRQLELFYNSQGNISRNDKGIRRFYLERNVQKVLSGDGARLATEMLPNFPNPPGSNSRLDTDTSMTMSTTPSTFRQRGIRCKMCRHDLATREHMLDHGQLEPSTPSTSPTITERPSDCRPELDADLPTAVPTMGSALPIPADANKLEDSKVATSQFIAQQLPRSEVANRPSPTTAITTVPSEHPSELYSDPDLPSPSRRPSDSSQQDPHIQHHTHPNPNSTHTLINPKCSGYFVEPMKWMDHFLSAGSTSGKITCPNTKCNAKLGNYDWAGVCCGCKVWVTPGFCINRSKVDYCTISIRSARGNRGQRS